MDYIGGVQIQGGLEYLVKKVLNVLISQFLLRVNYPVQVCLHQICDYIDILIGLWVLWNVDCQNFYYIFMIEEF